MKRRTFLAGLLALPFAGVAAKALAKDGLYPHQREALKALKLGERYGTFVIPQPPREHYHVVGATMQQVLDFTWRAKREYPLIQFHPVPISVSRQGLEGRLSGFRDLKIVLLDLHHDQVKNFENVLHYVNVKRFHGHTVKIIPVVDDFSLMFPDHLKRPA